jgi:pimeloyl-ACP methyl ester carboxylesterase
LAKDSDLASRQSPNANRTRIVPVVLVPGLMGTRLGFKNGKDWDPESKFWEMRHWLSMTADEKWQLLNSGNPATIIDELKDNGWKALVQDFYYPFLNALKDKGKFGGAKTPVYAVGYDWRQSCAKSGTYLETRINGILKENDPADQVILITHSMGGLVTRSALRQSPGLRGKVLGVAHVAQPVAGAVVLYRRLFTGMLPKLDGIDNLVKILGNSPYEFIVPMSGILGVFELLPTQQYRYIPADSPESPDTPDIAKLRGPWEAADKGYVDSLGRTVYPQGVSRRYSAADSPPGLFNLQLHGSNDRGITERTQSGMLQGVTSADHFQENLGLYLHPNTWMIYGIGQDTDVAVKFPVKDDKYDPLMLYRTSEGDGTVPAASGGALWATSDAATADNVKNADKRQFYVKGGDHADILNDKTVRAALFQMVYAMCQFSRTPGIPPAHP